MSARKRKPSNVTTLPKTSDADLEIARLRKLEVDGRFTPSGVLADARDPRSPLHKHFNWDDSKAAEAYRLQQARELITRYRVEITTTTRVVRAIAYVRDPRSQSDEQGMVSIARVMSEDDLAREVVVQEIGRALDMLRRANTQAQALGFGDVLEKLLADATAVRDSLSVGRDGSLAA